MKRIWFISVLLALSVARTEAYDFVLGQGGGMGNGILLSHSSPTMLLSAPTGGLQRGEWRIETGYDRPFDMGELDQFFAAAAWRYRSLTGVIGFSQFGQGDLYAEKTAKIGLGWQNRLISAGVTGSLLSVSFGGGYGSLSSGSIGLGLAVRRAPFYGAVSADNLTSPRLSSGSPKQMPMYNGYLEFVSSRMLSTFGRLRAQSGEQVQTTIGQRIGIGKGAALMWGASSQPTRLGLGIDLKVKGSAISYTVAIHPVLGLSHTIAVTYGARLVETGADEFK